MKKRFVGIIACGLLALALTGCENTATFTYMLGNASVDFKNFDGTSEGAFELPYFDVAYEVELESGTVDLEVLDAMVNKDSDGDVVDTVPLDTIYEAQGLTSGDSGTFSDDDGTIMVRVTGSDGATGTIRFTAA